MIDVLIFYCIVSKSAELIRRFSTAIARETSIVSRLKAPSFLKRGLLRDTGNSGKKACLLERYCHIHSKDLMDVFYSKLANRI